MGCVSNLIFFMPVPRSHGHWVGAGERLDKAGRGAEIKGATAARPGSAATGEREGSGNLKVKMQITQPGDGNPGGDGRRKGEESGAVRGASLDGKKGLWPGVSEVGPGTPPHR